jgi:hypothetical protein
MNLTLRLWSGYLDTAKILSLRTQSGRNTKEIEDCQFSRCTPERLMTPFVEKAQ